MADKIIFVAFAMEDVRMRDLLKGQSLRTSAPFQFVDMSVKEPYDTGWKDKVRTRILRSHGVIALVSESSLRSSGQIWEIECAIAEDRPVLGLWVYSDDRTRLPALRGQQVIPWSNDELAEFIDDV